MKKVLFSAVALAALAISAFAVESGLKKGESVSPFHPQHISGPLANSNKCFPCTFQQRPQVQVWVNGDNKANVTAVLKDLDKMIGTYTKNEFKALVVFVVPETDITSAKAAIGRHISQLGLKNVGVAVINKDHEAVTSYKINLDSSVKNTVFVYKNWKVTDKMVNLKADADGLASLNKAIAAIAK